MAYLQQPTFTTAGDERKRQALRDMFALQNEGAGPQSPNIFSQALGESPTENAAGPTWTGGDTFDKMLNEKKNGAAPVAPAVASPGTKPTDFSWDSITGTPGGTRMMTYLDPATGHLQSGEVGSINPADMSGAEFYRGLQTGAINNPANMPIAALNRWLNVGHGAAGETRADRERTLNTFLGINNAATEREAKLTIPREEMKARADLAREQYEIQFGKEARNRKYLEEAYDEARKLYPEATEADRRSFAEKRAAEKAAFDRDIVQKSGQGGNAPAAPASQIVPPFPGSPPAPEKTTPATGLQEPPNPLDRLDMDLKKQIVTAALSNGTVDANKLMTALSPLIQSGKVKAQNYPEIIKDLYEKAGGKESVVRALESYLAQALPLGQRIEGTTEGAPQNLGGIIVRQQFGNPLTPRYSGTTFEYPGQRIVGHPYRGFPRELTNRFRSTETQNKYSQQIPLLSELLGLAAR